MPETYAREQIYLHDEPEVDVKLQAIRIGDLGITALPNEVYGITGLKLKSASPLATTFNIELANGAQGYIPPPEQHALGGYTTWAARTAGLEVEAEPKIVATLLTLLEQVAGKPRRPIVTPAGDYSKAVIAAKPVAYWQLSELAGTQADDVTTTHHGIYEPGVAFYLPGPTGAGFSSEGRGNRAAHFAGGRVRAAVQELKDSYSVEFWFWNGLPHDARAVTGYLFSRGADADTKAAGDHLGIGGTYREDLAGKLIFFNGNELNEILVGRTTLELKTWNHVVLTRDDKRVNVFLNGNPQPEISGDAARGYADGVVEMFLGGRNDNLFNLEGKLDEVAVYDRVLPPAEVTAHISRPRVTRFSYRPTRRRPRSCNPIRLHNRRTNRWRCITFAKASSWNWWRLSRWLSIRWPSRGVRTASCGSSRWRTIPTAWMETAKREDALLARHQRRRQVRQVDTVLGRHQFPHRDLALASRCASDRRAGDFLCRGH